MVMLLVTGMTSHYFACLMLIAVAQLVVMATKQHQCQLSPDFPGKNTNNHSRLLAYNMLTEYTTLVCVYICLMLMLKYDIYQKMWLRSRAA